MEKLEPGVAFIEGVHTISKKGTLRGLHFQSPPVDHLKLVTCLKGKVFDVIVDLRTQSPTYGRFQRFELEGECPRSIFIPKGMAHGFYTLSDEAWVSYKVTSEHSPEHDLGILWNSLNIPWPDLEPILSERDRTFPKFSDFKSPF